MRELKGKLAFITGGASGIGLAIASAFGKEGMKLVVADIDPSSLDRAAVRLRDEGLDVHVLRLDVTDPAAWEEAARSVGPVDILVNNAGVGSSRTPIDEMSDADFGFVLGVNLHGIRHGIRTFLPRMKARSSPAHIVNTASITGQFAVHGIADYVTSKFAVTGLTEALRMELHGSHVSVSLLSPGLVATPLSQNARKVLPSVRASGEPVVVEAGPARGIPVEHVARCVVDAIKNDRFYIFTHPEYGALVELRMREIRDAMAAAPAADPKDDLAYLGKGVLAVSGPS